eukprot:3187244-Amphidinium_carterae.1
MLAASHSAHLRPRCYICTSIALSRAIAKNKMRLDNGMPGRRGGAWTDKCGRNPTVVGSTMTE